MTKSMAFAAAVMIAASISLGNIARADTTTTSATPPPAAAPRAQHPGLVELLKQLDLTTAQQSQIDTINSNAKPQADALMAQMQQLRKNTMKSIMDVLTPEQQTKLKGLQEQGSAHRAGFGEILMQLDLTDDQKSQIKTINANAQTQGNTIKADSTLTDDQRNTKMQQLRKDTMKSIMDVLTPEQQTKFKELQEQRKAGGAAQGANPSKSPNP